MSKETKLVADIVAYVGLVACATPWVLGVLYWLTGYNPLPRLTGFGVFMTMGVALVLAIVSSFLQSRIWKVLLPLTLVMFLFSWYVVIT